MANEIFATCMKLHIPPEKVVLSNNCEWIDGTAMNRQLALYRNINSAQNCEIMEKCFPKLYMYAKERETAASRYIIVSRNGFIMINVGRIKEERVLKMIILWPTPIMKLVSL